jgi:ribosomal protein L7/L12
MVIVNSSQTEVELTGWQRGALKVSATKAIREHTGLGLADAKGAVDICLDGQTTILKARDAAAARALVAQLNDLKFVARLR